MTSYETVKVQLAKSPRTWLVTGVAGFIGSHLLEALLTLNQRVTGLDNFATGFQKNLDDVRKKVTPAQWALFRFVKGDICSTDDCMGAFNTNSEPMDFVLHQAALGSIPRSLADPLATHETNITGFTKMLIASHEHRVKRFVFASSSSVYGDSPALPKCESVVGKPLSPYALSKSVNEQYAEVFAKCFDLTYVGLRYFNVFGPRQNPAGAYAAVIPKWINAMIQNETVQINGDGSTSRDFCYVTNAVQANILAATCTDTAACNQIYNIALGDRTNLNELHQLISSTLRHDLPSLQNVAPTYQNERPGDVKHSLANIAKAKDLLGYAPSTFIASGLKNTCEWFLESNQT
jgi:UDP-N-acetylglucosamine/UDP-N-acetylgalactosamine 4-epimerase